MMDAPKLRILHVVNSLEPGGLENGVVNVSNRLSENGFDVHICCLDHGGEFVNRLHHPENVITLNRAPGFSLKTVARLARVIWNVRPDVVHSHNLAPLTYSALATGFGFWKPLLQGEHGVFPREQGSPHRVKFRKRLYQAASRISTVSDDLRKWIIDKGYDGSKIVAVVNGVDTDHFQPGDKAAARAALGLPTDGEVVGIVGRLVPGKKHSVLLDAFERVANQFPAARLLVVGDSGSEAEYVRAAAKASVASDRIHLVGFQSDTLRCYQAMDILAAPSPDEGLSNAVLEAMSCGVNVIAHEACGNRDVITNGQDGIVSDIGPSANLAAQLARVLGDSGLRNSIGFAARKTILQRFTLERMANDYAELYCDLTATQPWLSIADFQLKPSEATLTGVPLAAADQQTSRP
ncbi:MAG: glycosyltransferase [Verrucomicrobiia bacterium]|jgi:glycosyltransferase involved in cell wall biosynthesis